MSYSPRQDCPWLPPKDASQPVSDRHPADRVGALLRWLGDVDPDLLGHSRRVSALCDQLGRAIGLGSADLRALAVAAPLHDIGKLALPSALLNKPGPLTATECAALRAHPGLGEQWVRRRSAASPAVLGAIRHHHEHWNGRGYPDGLQGQQIPLLARLLTVCDVYDALRSPRGYKPAWTPAAARAELERCAGHHLDPGLVAAFLPLLEPS
ncbi:HD-GYP domain-containing protein [Deinococcus hohokamensis]|uniref:HD-GYP domain-containing protein n=1 Tax=Deinococcus hohokamensis TaxID=309883 RepID=A0ABV9I9Q4_9DEIO